MRLLLLFAFCIPLAAQTPDAATIRAQAKLVVVDVVVTDSRQNPVHHLNASDFTLLENNLPQTVKSFEEHTAPSPEEIARRPPLPKMLPGYFTNYSPAPVSGTLNVLLLDTLNTPMNAQAYVRSQLLDYLQHAPTGAPVAIFGLVDHLLLLQSFTSDPAVLSAAVNARGEAQMSPLLDNPLDGTAVESITDFMGAPGTGKADANVTKVVQQNDARRSSNQQQQRALYTLNAMNQLARYLESIPGRKNLIWFSGSFPLSVLPNGDLDDPFAFVADMRDEYRETTNLLARGQVAVYPVDARGIVNSTVHTASNPAKGYGGNPKAFAKDQANFYQTLFQEHDTMQQMAQDTGGRAFVDTDGLTQALAQAIRSGSDYYTISYTPTDNDWNGKYRRILVKMTQHGLTLAYRRGYFADDPDAPPRPGHVSVTASTRPGKQTGDVALAMMRGAPGPTEILLKIRMLPASADTETTVAEGNELNPDLKVMGPFRRILIDSEADCGALHFTTSPDGHHHASVEFITFVYNRQGEVVTAIDTPVDANLTPARYAAILRSGLPFHQEVSVPADGEYFIRIAVHDMRSDRLGALEVPVAAIAKLPPAKAR